MDDLISNLTRFGADEGMRIGDAIRRERKKAGLSQGELADRLGITRSLIGQYERGIRNPKPFTVQRIADALGIHSAYLTPVSPTEPKIIYCKDCIKHNKKVGFDKNFHTVWKEEACPLVSWRGKAKGHEFDHQFCAFGERKEVTE